jgi:hypothetical protein
MKATTTQFMQGASFFSPAAGTLAAGGAAAACVLWKGVSFARRRDRRFDIQESCGERNLVWIGRWI